MSIRRCSRPTRLALLALLPAALAACAPKQRIRFDCVPKTVTVYLDKEPLAEVPDEVVLRSDRPHTLAFTGGGYEKEFVVLESRETSSGHELVPPDVCTRVEFVEVRKDLELELEGPDAGAGAD